MNIKPLTAGLSVSPQISIADLQALKAQGFRTVICNRPDGEEADQPSFTDIDAAAQQIGLATAFIPVDPTTPVAGAVEAFVEALRTLPWPVLAYCRSGARSEALWEQSVRHVEG